MCYYRCIVVFRSVTSPRISPISMEIDIFQHISIIALNHGKYNVKINGNEKNTKYGWLSFGLAAVLGHIEHIEELLAGKVTREWLQRLEPMHENHRIAMIQKIFGRCRATRTSTKIVHESYGIMF